MLPKFHFFSLLISIAMLSTPFWKFSNFISNELIRIVLIGNCNISTYSYGEWPILPWVFLPIFSINYAFILKDNIFFEKISLVEWSLWSAAIIFLGFNFWGEYFYSTVENYSCSIFSKNPIVFWSHMLPFLFIIRLNRVQKYSKVFENKFTSFIANFFWIKNFGLTYLISLALIGILSVFGEADNIPRNYQPYYYFTLIFIVVSLSEFIAKNIKRITTS